MAHGCTVCDFGALIESPPSIVASARAYCELRRSAIPGSVPVARWQSAAEVSALPKPARCEVYHGRMVGLRVAARDVIVCGWACYVTCAPCARVVCPRRTAAGSGRTDLS